MDSEDIVRKFHQKRGRIRDPGSGKNPSRIRIQGVKKHRIPDPDPQHWYKVNESEILKNRLKNVAMDRSIGGQQGTNYG
jgi:hypothetical protein